MKPLIAAAVLGLSACATLTPDAVRLEVQHTSHITQHFGANYPQSGYDALMLDLHWDNEIWHMDLKEGINLDQRDAEYTEAYGGLAGPQEVFQATLGVDLWSKK